MSGPDPDFAAGTDLPRTEQAPARARLRQRPEDFQVEELPLVLPEGHGEHLWVRLRKRDHTTPEAAAALADWAGVRPAAVGFAGLKDRRAVTTQWFSLHLPGRPDPDPGAFAVPGMCLLESGRHGRKLRRGVLRGNRFRLRLRAVAGDRDAIDHCLETIGRRGFPNYFGAQRFGRNQANLGRAASWFAGRLRPGRAQRGYLLSAARALLFNQVLAARVLAGHWDQALTGDLMQFDGGGSLFLHDGSDASVPMRTAAGEVHPTGPLWGRGGRRPAAAAAEVERAALAPLGDWCRALEGFGMTADRRPLRARVRDLAWHWEDAATLELDFTLGRGSYATMLVREFCAVDGDG